MLQKFNVKVLEHDDVCVLASSLEQAKEIVQAYIDKRSLN